MSRREDVDNAIWSDPDFEGLSPAAKLTYLWSFTNPRCGMAGIYQVSLRAVTFETGLSVEQAQAAMGELERHRFVFFDGKVLWIRARVKHLRSRHPNFAKSIWKDVERVASHPFAAWFLTLYGSDSWLDGDDKDRITKILTAKGLFPCPIWDSADPTQTLARVLGQGQGQGLVVPPTFLNPESSTNLETQDDSDNRENRLRGVN